MAIGFGGAFGMLKQALKDFGEDECPRMAAALSYYTVFALPPLLILLLLVVGAVMDPQDVQRALQGQMGQMMGPEAADQVQIIMRQAERPGGRGLSAVLGVGALVLGATGAFLALQGALNRAWEVKPDPQAGGIRNFVFKRLLSLGMILGVAFLLLVSLALSTVLSAAGSALAQVLPLGSATVAYAINLALSLAVIAFLFAAIFKILPDAVVAWRDVWVGGAFTALLFVLGKWALGFYLGRSNPGEAFGAAGSLAMILVWIYYSSMIVLFGAEFTQVWAHRRGREIVPEPGAVRVIEETREVRPGQREVIPQPKDDHTRRTG